MRFAIRYLDVQREAYVCTEIDRFILYKNKSILVYQLTFLIKRKGNYDIWKNTRYVLLGTCYLVLAVAKHATKNLHVKESIHTESEHS